MLSILHIMLIFILITMIGYILSMNKEYKILNFRVKFTLGGILLFLGKEYTPAKEKPIRKEMHVLFIVVAFLGIILFYLFFLPIIINMVKSFIEFIYGYTSQPPQPTLIPIPFLLQYKELAVYLIIAIAIGVIVHELSHAIVALREGVKIRSWGIGMLFLFPIAFVELDEEQFTKASPRSKINIATAGIFSNAVVSLTAFTLLLIISNILPSLGVISTAIVVNNVDCSICNTTLCPAQQINISNGDIIVAIDNLRIYTPNDVEKTLANKKIGDAISLKICNNNECNEKRVVLNAINMKIYSEKGLEIPCLGISMAQTMIFEKNGLFYRYPAIENLIMHLNFIFIVNFSLYVLNAIPFVISDGSIFIKALSEILTPLKLISSKKILDLFNITILIIAIVISSYVFLRFTP